MKIFDFDEDVQKVINDRYINLPSIKWRNWMDIDSKEKYINFVLNSSGLINVSDILTKTKNLSINSSSFSIDFAKFVEEAPTGDPLVICHTSGTTDSRINALKWYHMTFSNVRRYWAPGMKAIFESSGLKKDNSVVIFVPSRLKFDGLKIRNGKKYVSLYSSEFSQRIMLSIIRPASYSFFEYKNVLNLEVISKILNLEDIAVISAPAITILKWADVDKLREGIEKYLKSNFDTENDYSEKYLNMIKSKGLRTTAKIIQQELSEKLKDATLVFSISSLSERNWDLIRKFMNWKKGFEKFTNLYVVSEVGPVASSLGNFEISRLNQMYMLPLSLPVIESKSKKELLTNSIYKIGKLLINRMEGNNPLINIDIGDVIKINSQDGLPIIDGKIYRNSFKLKYPISISNRIEQSDKYEIYVGDFFDMPNFEFFNPRKLLEGINNIVPNLSDSLLLSVRNEEKILYLPRIDNISSQKKIEKIILDSFNSKAQVRIEYIEEQPINFLKDRSIMLNKVRSGKIPKGVLKKWPLYVLKQ